MGMTEPLQTIPLPLMWYLCWCYASTGVWAVLAQIISRIKQCPSTLCTHLVEDTEVGSKYSKYQGKACDVHPTEIQKAAHGLLSSAELMRWWILLLVIHATAMFCHFWLTVQVQTTTTAVGLWMVTVSQSQSYWAQLLLSHCSGSQGCHGHAPYWNKKLQKDTHTRSGEIIWTRKGRALKRAGTPKWEQEHASTVYDREIFLSMRLVKQSCNFQELFS